MTFWTDRRVFLTGGHGFLGRVLRRQIEDTKPSALFSPSSKELDLRDAGAVGHYLKHHRPDIVIHAAARVGGIGANRAAPGSFFYDNALMGLHLIEESRVAAVEKFVCIGTVCAYPKFTPVPFREADLWIGYPEETNAAYGLAKKMLLVQLQAYREEFGFRGIFLLPANLYGPGDNFDPNTSHVIPAMIRKFANASDRGESEVVLWGDGSPTREFLFVEDAAAGILLAAERYESAEPLNLGTGDERSIHDLASLIAREIGYDGRIVWDTTKPNGQPRRRIDTTRAQEEIGFRAATPFHEGLRKTIDWFNAEMRGVKTTPR